MLKYLCKALLLTVCITQIIGCGPDTNILGYFEPEGKKNAYDALILRAEYAYNKEEYEEASEIVDKALEINTNNEEAAILKGYILMSQGGIDGFQLAEGLIDQSSTTSLALQLANDDDCAGNEGASAVLCKLQNTIGMSVDEKNQLLTGETSTIGDKTIETPKSATDARIAGVNVINKMNEAISTICPYVDTSVLNPDDSRHICTANDNSNRLSAKANYLWAFAHLIEGVAFYSVFFQNLVDLEAALSSASSADSSNYISTLTAVATISNTLLPTNQEDAILNAIYDDFDTTSAGFRAIPGMPDKITKSIEDAATKLKEKSSTVGEAGALKQQLAAKMTKAIQSKVYSCSGSTCSANSFGEQIKTSGKEAEFCSAYASITGLSSTSTCLTQ